jgi:hypothetical protein
VLVERSLDCRGITTKACDFWTNSHNERQPSIVQTPGTLELAAITETLDCRLVKEKAVRYKDEECVKTRRLGRIVERRLELKI